MSVFHLHIINNSTQLDEINNYYNNYTTLEYFIAQTHQFHSTNKQFNSSTSKFIYFYSIVSILL